MDRELESKIDVIADKLNSGFKEKLPRDIEIHGLEKEHQSFNSGGSILKIAPSTDLHIQPALKNTHCIKTYASEEGLLKLYGSMMNQ